MRTIPLVDLSQFEQGNLAQRNEFIETLGNAFHTVGFVGVVNHGIPSELIKSFYKEANAFFALSEKEKLTYKIPGANGQRGYTAFGTEHAKQSKVADLKEFFQIGNEGNIAVSEIPSFLNLGENLYREFERAGSGLLQAIALHLHLPVDYFDQRIKNGTSILRAIHYPPITQEPASAIRAEQHEDINLITLLVGASAGGLELLSKEGEWLPIVPEADEIVINVGDMLQRLTNNYLRSTTHRVVNPPREEWHLPRLSIPFFLHPRPEMDLSCLENCISDKNPLHFEPITAGAYLDERLREIGLKK
ncbi:MAG: isopenicillin N synthase family oxygenase [Bacteroidetes bacterium]|jgi:isopenicillin N synthase-like dioxygenase|nr:isopenicillin N synthase family oxygenase [Bacteroidota bacterium]